MTKLSEVIARPPTLSLSTRVDMRHLATLYNFWASHNETPRSISELSRLSLEGLAEMLVSSGSVAMVETQENAHQILLNCGMLNDKSIQRRNLLKALAREDLMHPLRDSHGAISEAIPRDLDHGMDLKEAEERLTSLMTSSLYYTPAEDLSDLAIRPDDPTNKGEL